MCFIQLDNLICLVIITGVHHTIMSISKELPEPLKNSVIDCKFEKGFEAIFKLFKTHHFTVP